MTDNNTGYLLNNRYRLIDQIGEGGMANVYLGKDTILNSYLGKLSLDSLVKGINDNVILLNYFY